MHRYISLLILSLFLNYHSDAQQLERSWLKNIFINDHYISLTQSELEKADAQRIIQTPEFKASFVKLEGDYVYFQSGAENFKHRLNHLDPVDSTWVYHYLIQQNILDRNKHDLIQGRIVSYSAPLHENLINQPKIPDATKSTCKHHTEISHTNHTLTTETGGLQVNGKKFMLGEDLWYRSNLIKQKYQHLHFTWSDTEISKNKGRKHEAVTLNEGSKLTWTDEVENSRIEVYPATGLVKFIHRNKEVYTTSVVDQSYIDAVRSGSLDVLTGETNFARRENGTYRVPIIVRGFPLLEQSYREDDFRSWVVCIGGKNRVNDPVLKDVAFWIIAPIIAKYDINNEDLTILDYKNTDRGKKRMLDDYSKANSGFGGNASHITWIKTFTSIDVSMIENEGNKLEYGGIAFAMRIMRSEKRCFYPNSLEPVLSHTDALLLGFGVIGHIQDSSMITFPIVGIDGKDYYISRFGKIQKCNGRRSNSGTIENNAIILSPQRNEDGSAYFFKNE